jgi:stress response protein YsnF
MADDDEKIYLLEEQAIVSKRLKATDVVRVHTVVHSDEEIVAAPVRTEKIEVERVPIDRWVDAPIPERQEGDTRIITLHAEVMVTETRLKATEEIRLTKRCHTHRATERVTLRREEAVVERIPAHASGNDEQS